MSFCLIWLISYEFPTGKGDDMCRKIVNEKYFTFVSPCPVEPRYTLPLQLEEANWSESALFVIKYVDL